MTAAITKKTEAFLFEGFLVIILAVIPAMYL